MAPPKQAAAPSPPFAKDERVLCFHMEMLYEAKILDVRPGEGGEGWQFKIHYKGWKASWDDWVPHDRVLKFNDENKELARQLLQNTKSLQPGKSSGKTGKKGGAAGGRGGSELGSARGSEERGHQAQTQSGRGPRRARDFELEQEDAFHARPSIKLNVPDNLKAYLVDDWENVTKNQQLVGLPHPHPVDEVLEEYLKYERQHREVGSHAYDVLEETILGLREYFDKCLGRILLYRFERQQYVDMYKKWQAAGPEDKHKCAADTYGPEHLCRLLVTLPELVAQTNMDQQSVSRLREELLKFSNWLSKHGMKYFVSEYETPDADYIEKARGT
ncbi:MRG-domain-containing protein [Coniochaeta sp. 2T2.1]|nr:MRG-domain-containing protein [Coniochaeta sp. 2T2.1]